MSKLVILGSGESGMGAAKLARKQGLEVLVSDSGAISEEHKKVLSNIEASWEEKGHSEAVFSASEVVKSPGIPDTISLIQDLLKKGVPVISEIEFAARYTKATLVAITGSNGKTTTATLTQHILKKAGVDSILAGNVGNSFAAAVAEREPAVFVLELSSFQLDGIVDFKPHIAMLLNITPDHLDRYEYDIDKYADSKFRIAKNQSKDDWFIFNQDDAITLEGFKRNSVSAQRLPMSIHTQLEVGAWIENDNIHTLTHDKLNTMSIYKLALAGKHNLYNSMAAGMAGRVLDLKSESIRESLSDFQNVEHRLEFLGKVNGVEYINDSKATNVNATWYALESMNNPVVWIVGGVDKGNDYSQLVELAKAKVKAIICLGKENDKIKKAFEGVVDDIYETGSASEAVRVSSLVGRKGDTVLLSPCCASFDLFDDYEDRGRKFKRAVRSL